MGRTSEKSSKPDNRDNKPRRIELASAYKVTSSLHHHKAQGSLSSSIPLCIYTLLFPIYPSTSDLLFERTSSLAFRCFASCTLGFEAITRHKPTWAMDTEMKKNSSSRPWGNLGCPCWIQHRDPLLQDTPVFTPRLEAIACPGDHIQV